MTEFLDNMFTSDIDEVKHEIFQKLEAEAASPAFRRSLRGFAGAGIQVDLEDPRHFAATTILISEVAQRLTVQQEKDGLRFIPQHLLEGLTPMAARDLAYTAIRNVVARRLGKIVPGKHGLLEHNEELIVVGPTAPEFNKGTTAFRVGTASGELSEQNKSLTFTLHDILRDRFKEEGVSPREEALIVLVLEAFDPNEHGNNKKVERRVHNEVFSMVGDNASELRLARIKDVRGGYLVVVGAIIDPNTKVIREIVR